MHLILFIVIAFLFWMFFPRAADVFAWVLTLGFTVPLLTVAAGSVAWGIHMIFFGGSLTVACWTRDLLLFGLPFGGWMGWNILKS